MAVIVSLASATQVNLGADQTIAIQLVSLLLKHPEEDARPSSYRHKNIDSYYYVIGYYRVNLQLHNCAADPPKGSTGERYSKNNSSTSFYNHGQKVRECVRD